MTSQMNSNQELFLDILTKEEREALLTKKMEEIRKRNEALQKRHEEIEADRKGFDATHKKVSSPQKESKKFPEDVRKDISAPADGRNHKDYGRPRPKSAGRGKSPIKQHKDTQRAQDLRVRRSLSGDERNARNVSMVQSPGGDNSQKNQSDPPRLQRPVSKEYDDHEAYSRPPLREGNQDRQQKRNSAEFGDHGTYRGAENQGGGSYERLRRQQDRPSSGHFENQQDFRQPSNGYQRLHSRENEARYHKQHSWENDYGRQQNGFHNRQLSQEAYQRRESWENDHDHTPNHRNYERRQNSYENDASQSNKRNFKEKRVEFDFTDFEPQAKRKQGGGRGRGSPRKDNQGYDFSNSPHGPPPDPAYNFLSDKYRDIPRGDNRGPRENERKDGVRRHPKNYGGDDFHNVKERMKREKEKQDRVRAGPPKSKMEMSINMTGKERRQYVEWKAEREKVDQARIDRQKSSSGEWRREWDVQKDQTEFEESPPPRTEPGKRPAGRIGSGRFDHGEYDDRLKGPGRPEKGQGIGGRGERPEGHQKEGMVKSPNSRNEKQSHGKEGGPPRQPIGRGRGRGWGRGKPGGGNQEVGRVRTSSGDDRKVDLKRDLLVIKLDNTPGKPHDDSVEVEYSDGEGNGIANHGSAPGTTPPKKSGIQTEELWWDEEADEMAMALQLEDVLEHKELFQDDGTHELEYDEEGHLLVGGNHTSQGDTDEWTDCTSEDFYSTDRSQSQTSVDADLNSPLKVNVHLNPDAPEFTPSSPVVPVSPESNVTPPSKVKVTNWKNKEGSRKHKVSEGSRSEGSEAVDEEKAEENDATEEEDREDREATPRGDNFEDAEENDNVGKNSQEFTGGVNNTKKTDSEVIAESEKSGSTDEKEENAPAGNHNENDKAGSISTVNEDQKVREDIKGDSNPENAPSAEPQTEEASKDSPEVDVDHGEKSKDCDLPSDATPTDPPCGVGEEEEAHKPEVSEGSNNSAAAEEENKEESEKEMPNPAEAEKKDTPDAEKTS